LEAFKQLPKNFIEQDKDVQLDVKLVHELSERIEVLHN
jgi:hypothetical protein